MTNGENWTRLDEVKPPKPEKYPVRYLIANERLQHISEGFWNGETFGPIHVVYWMKILPLSKGESND